MNATRGSNRLHEAIVSEQEELRPEVSPGKQWEKLQRTSSPLCRDDVIDDGSGVVTQLAAERVGLLHQRFARHDVEECAWKLLAPILEGWDASAQEPFRYERGSDGPAEAAALLREDGRGWRPLRGTHEPHR